MTVKTHMLIGERVEYTNEIGLPLAPRAVLDFAGFGNTHVMLWCASKIIKCRLVRVAPLPVSFPILILRRKQQNHNLSIKADIWMLFD